MMCAGWIRFRASLMATRRISWIDQRINDGVAPFLFLLLPWSGVPFFWRRRIGAMADHRHHGEGEHHQRNVAMPPMPGSALVVIEPELVFRGLKTVLDCPPMAFDRHQRFDGCCRWTPGGEEGEIAPIMQPRSFGPVPCRQAFPVGRTPRRGDVRGGAGDWPPLTPGLKHMSAADPKHIAFACLA